MIILAWPEVWELKGQDEWGEQTTDYIHIRAVGILWVQQCLSDWPMPPLLMETCLGDLNLNWCIIYLDDIVIFSKDPASHLMRLDAMSQKL